MPDAVQTSHRSRTGRMRRLHRTPGPSLEAAVDVIAAAYARARRASRASRSSHCAPTEAIQAIASPIGAGSSV